jgi:hypothetical protein
MRNALAHAGRQGRVVSAFIGTAFVQEDAEAARAHDAEAARAQWRSIADQLRLKVPKLAALMDDAVDFAPALAAEAAARKVIGLFAWRGLDLGTVAHSY